MNKYIKIVKLILILIVCGIVIYFITHYNNMKDRYEVLERNQKALIERYNNIETDNYELTFTVEEYQYYNDSLLNRLKETQMELDIKYDEILYLESLNTDFRRTDTILVNEVDTIFVQGVSVDTIFGDEYITNNLKLDYPNRVELTTTVYSKKDVFITQERETINPPKKCWIGRLFQKKHDIIKVHIKEHNPWVINNEEMFIKIIE